MGTLKQISIVIPAYNRAHLIGETLDSILAQTYTNWECLIVDDGSSDQTVQVIDHYAKKDDRFKRLIRPESKPKGANACRNIGLESAVGDYVVFFDSDDLMTPDHLETKIQAIETGDFDYSITKTKFFNYETNRLDRYYRFDTYEITPYNYVSQNINWLTYDICLKAALAKTIRFNEQLQSGQEYNYFSKLVHVSVNAIFINKVVSLRRYHEASVRAGLIKNNKQNESRFIVNWLTYLELKRKADKRVLRVLINRCIRLSYVSKGILIKNKTRFGIELFNFFGYRGVYFYLMLFGQKMFKRGYFFRQKLLK